MPQKGFAPIVLLISVAILGLTILKIPSIFSSPKPLVTPQEQKTPIIKTPVVDENAQQARLEKYLVAEAALLGVADNIENKHKIKTRKVKKRIYLTLT